MPFEITPYPNQGLVHVRYFGAASLDDVMQAAQACSDHPDVAPNHSRLVDLSDISGVDADYRSLMTLVKREKMLTENVAVGCRQAIFAPGALTFGLARIYQQLAGQSLPYESDVFRTLTNALRFAGVSDTYFAQEFGAQVGLRLEQSSD